MNTDTVNSNRIFDRKIVFWLVLCGIAMYAISGRFVFAQGEREAQAVDEESPEEVVRFHETFLSMYMKNYYRINNLKSMRDTGSQQEVRELKETIRQESTETLKKLRNEFRAAREKQVSDPMLNSMNKLLKTYSLYIEKITKDWEPSKEQVIKRRRMSDNQILNENPKLATPSLLRRVFLGELISSTQTVPELNNWFKKRIAKVSKWISSKQDQLYSLFVELVSRVDRAMNNDDKEKEEVQRVVNEARSEWQRFWKDIGEGSGWADIRKTASNLRSFFRNRSNRLPGNQERLNNRVQKLQTQIGDLQRLRIDHPFKNKEKRLETMLRLGKSFVNRAKQVGDGQASSALSNIVIEFVTDFSNRKPGQYWDVDSKDELKKKEEQQTSFVKGLMMSLKEMNYSSVRERFNLPIDSVLHLSRRLNTNYGKKEKEMAKIIRNMARFVRARYRLVTDGVDMMKKYRKALKQFEHERPEGYIQFEKSFREKNKSTLLSLKGEVNLIRDMRSNIDEMTERMRKVKPDELATAFFKDSNEKRR